MGRRRRQAAKAEDTEVWIEEELGTAAERAGAPAVGMDVSGKRCKGIVLAMGAGGAEKGSRERGAS